MGRVALIKAANAAINAARMFTLPWLFRRPLLLYGAGLQIARSLDGAARSSYSRDSTDSIKIRHSWEGSNLDIKQLRTLLAVAETGSLTGASSLLNIVQPALSRQIKMLEDELGSPVFQRSQRGMQLTEVGVAFVERVKRGLRELDRAKAEIKPQNAELRGIISIGMLPSFAAGLSPNLILSLREQHPHLMLRITTGFTGALAPLLESGNIDVGLITDYKSSSVLSMQPVRRERLYLMGHSKSGLRPKKPWALNALAKLPLILPAYAQGIRELIDNACTIIGTRLNIIAESNDVNVKLNLVASGQAFTILPLVSLSQCCKANQIRYAPITSPILYRRLVIAQSIAKSSTAARQIVINAMHQHLGGLLRNDEDIE
jgi:LysR family transcriptional regulator, nitrogen assimilation regulatory protein